jgi:hypothetical protein
MRRSAAFAVVLAWAPLLTAGGARAACQIGSFDPVTSVFHLDANDNGLWDGVAGGDVASEVASFAGPGLPLVGDWNGDGVDDTGKLVGLRFYLDMDGDRKWTGNAGGDRNTSFAASFVVQEPVVGDWNGDGRDQIGVYLGQGRFLLDANGNGIWDGAAGGDYNVLFARRGNSTPIIADWNGDGVDDVGILVPFLSGFRPVYAVLDWDGDRIWAGQAGGDAATSLFYGTPVLGDWLGIGQVSFGDFSADRSTFHLDANADLLIPSVGGGDIVGSLGLFTGVGSPLVCDWDGDGDTDLGKVTPSGRFVLDRNGNRQWDGAALGDRSTVFDVGAPATPLVGRWVAP